jgi:hypothetical protein
VAVFFRPGVAQDDTQVFSGPQVGEKLAPFSVQGVFDDEAGKSFDFVTKAEDKPILLLFVHELTRPSVAVTRSIMKYAGERKKDGLSCGLVFLSDDPTAIEQQLKRARHALPPNTPIGISTEGREGPGSYGLNRDMTLTVLIADKGHVTANFAIVQPTPAVDVPKIVKEITHLIGGDVPSLAELGIQRYEDAPRRAGEDSKRARGADDLSPEMQGKLRQLIRRTNTNDDVKRIAQEIEEILKKDKDVRATVGVIASRVQNANYFPDLVSEAQSVLRRWAKEYGPQRQEEPRGEENKPSAED